MSIGKIDCNICRVSLKEQLEFSTTIPCLIAIEKQETNTIPRTLNSDCNLSLGRTPLYYLFVLIQSSPAILFKSSVEIKDH